MRLASLLSLQGLLATSLPSHAESSDGRLLDLLFQSIVFEDADRFVWLMDVVNPGGHHAYLTTQSLLSYGGHHLGTFLASQDSFPRLRYFLETLLDYGADFKTPDYHGRTPMALAIENGNVRFVRLLASYFPRRKRLIDYWMEREIHQDDAGLESLVGFDMITPPPLPYRVWLTHQSTMTRVGPWKVLGEATEYRENLRWVITENPLPSPILTGWFSLINHCDEPWNCPLNVALRRHDLPLVDYLAGQGARPAEPEPDMGLTPLAQAAELGDVDLASRVLNLGMSCFQSGDGTRLPLSFAIRSQKQSTTYLLLHHPACQLKPPELNPMQVTEDFYAMIAWLGRRLTRNQIHSYLLMSKEAISPACFGKRNLIHTLFHIGDLKLLYWALPLARDLGCDVHARLPDGGDSILGHLINQPLDKPFELDLVQWLLKEPQLHTDRHALFTLMDGQPPYSLPWKHRFREMLFWDPSTDWLAFRERDMQSADLQPQTVLGRLSTKEWLHRFPGSATGGGRQQQELHHLARFRMFDIYSQVFKRQERLVHDQQSVREPDVYDPVNAEQHWFPASVEHQLRAGPEVRSRLLQDPARASVDVDVSVPLEMVKETVAFLHDSITNFAYNRDHPMLTYISKVYPELLEGWLCRFIVLSRDAMARFEFVLDIMLEQPFPGYSLRCPKIHFQDEMHPDPDRDYFLRETLQEDLEPLLTRVVRLLANARGDWGMITPRDSYYQSVLVKLMAAVVTTSEDIKLTQELVATLEWDAHTQTKAVDLRFDVRRRPFRVHIQNEVYEALSMADHRRAKLEPLKETLRQHIVFWFPRLQRYFQPEPFWRIIDQNTRAVQRLLPKPEIFRMRSAFDESKTRLLSLFFSPHGIHVDRRLPATDYIVAFLVVVVTVTMFLVVSFFVRRMERPHIDSARLIPEPVFNRVTLLRSLQKQFQGDVTHYFRFDRAPRLMTRMYMRFRILGCGVTVCYLVYLARYLETMFFLFLVASTIAYRTIWATAMTPDAKQLILPVFLRKVNPMDDPPPGDDTLGEFREQIRDTQMVHVEHYRFWLAVYSTLAGLLGVVPLVYRATYKTYLEFYQSGEALDFVTTFWMVNLLFELVYRVELVLHFYDTLKICMFACMNSDCEEKSLRLFLMEFPFLEPYLAGVGPMDHADASVGHFLRLMHELQQEWLQRRSLYRLPFDALLVTSTFTAMTLGLFMVTGLHPCKGDFLFLLTTWSFLLFVGLAVPMAKLHRVLDYMFKLMIVYMDLVQQVDTFEHDFFVMSHFRHGRGSRQKLLPEDLQLRFMNMDGGELGILAVFGTVWVEVKTPKSMAKLIEVILNDRLGKKVRVKCNSDDTVGDLKKLAAAQLGSPADRLVIKKWYTVYKDHIRLDDYEIHDGMSMELYYL